MSVPAPRVKYSPPSVPAGGVAELGRLARHAPGTSILAGMSFLLTCMVPSSSSWWCGRLSSGGACSVLASGLVSSRNQPQPRAELGVEHVLAPEDLPGHHRRVGQRDLERRLGEVVDAGEVVALVRDAVAGGEHRFRRQQRVHRDVVRRDLERDRLREVVHRRLVAAVREHGRTARVVVRAGTGHERGEGADVHDPAATELDHVGQHELHEAVGREQPDLEVQPVPLEREAEERTRRGVVVVRAGGGAFGGRSFAAGASPFAGGRPGTVSAALFTRRSIGPNAARASSTTRSTSSSSPRSARIATARPPSASIAATVSWIVPGSRSSKTCSVRATTATAAPSRRRAAPPPHRCPGWRR